LIIYIYIDVCIILFYFLFFSGVRVDTEVLKFFVQKKQPKLFDHFTKYNIDINVVSLRWFMCLFILTLPYETTARILDVLFFEGTIVLFNISLALLEMYKKDLLKINDSSSLLSALNKIGMNCTDADSLLKLALTNKNCIFKEVELVKYRGMYRKQLEEQYLLSLQEQE
jgi:hypothetical protein